MTTQPSIRQRRRLDLGPAPEAAEEVKGVAPDVHEGFVHVTRVPYGSKEEEIENQRVRVPLFATQVARIRVNAGVTRNMGDYNSARVDVMVELPCYPVDTEISRAYERIETILDELLPRECAKAGFTL